MSVLFGLLVVSSLLLLGKDELNAEITMIAKLWLLFVARFLFSLYFLEWNWHYFLHPHQRMEKTEERTLDWNGKNVVAN